MTPASRRRTLTGTATHAIHGTHLRAWTGSVAPPLHQTSTFRFADSTDAVRYAAGDPDVYVYTRYHNPTVREAQDRLALVLGADRALLVASGMAAISSAVLAEAGAGDEIITTPALYGGTYRFFRDILPRLGIRVRMMDPRRPEGLGRLVTARTRLVYLETPTNPTLRIVDIAAVAAAIRRTRRRLTLVCDNTFATSLNQNPFALGADVVIESATKYIGGHSDVVAGVVAGDRGRVDRAHGVMKYLGSCADPFAALLLLRSLKTFVLRVGRQNEHALALAAWLEKHPRVLRVHYPGLPSHPDHAAALRQMHGGFGGMVTIEVSGGARGAARVCDALRVAVNAMSLGGAETLVSIPVYSSHTGMSAAELRRHGVTPGMIRISTGLEDIEDLFRDFDRALRR